MESGKPAINPGTSNTMYSIGDLDGIGVPEVDEFLNLRLQDTERRVRGVRISAEIKRKVENFFEERKKAGPGLMTEKDLTKSLHRVLNNTHKRIRIQDVERWTKKYNWAAPVEERPPSAPAAASTSPSAGLEGTSKSINPNTGEETMGLHSSENVSARNDEAKRSVQLKRSCDKFGDLIREMSAICHKGPEFRAGLVLLKPLANLVTRNTTKAILGDDRREDLLAGQMRLPQNRGFKREVPTSSFSENDVDVVVMEDDLL